jgi:hypothetical protein
MTKLIHQWGCLFRCCFIIGMLSTFHHVHGDHFVPEQLSTMRTYLSYTGGKGVGYSTGYTSYELFYTPVARKWDNKQLFTDFRYHCFDHGKQALNAGVGGRYYYQPWDAVLGANLYYDYYRSSRSFSQVGVGLEYLGDLFDIRVNGYFPVGSQTGKTKLIGNCKENQQALTGFDAEIYTGVGKFIEEDTFNLYGAIGGYFYKGKGKSRQDVGGGRLRLGLSIEDLVTLEMSTTYDTVFKFGYQGTLMLTLPFSYFTSERLDAVKNYERYMTRQRVYRNEIIVNKKQKN